MRNLLRLVVLILILVVGNVVGMMFLFFIANLDQMKDGLILGGSMIIAGFAVFFYLIYFLVVKLK